MGGAGARCPSCRAISSPMRAPRRQTRTARDAPGRPKGGSGTARSSSRTRLVTKVGLKSTLGSFSAGSNRSLSDPLLPQVAAHVFRSSKVLAASRQRRRGAPQCVAGTSSVFRSSKVLAASRQQRRGAPHSVAGTSFRSSKSCLRPGSNDVEPRTA